jgi:hypothetical protein
MRAKHAARRPREFSSVYSAGRLRWMRLSSMSRSTSGKYTQCSRKFIHDADANLTDRNGDI